MDRYLAEGRTAPRELLSTLERQAFRSACFRATRARMFSILAALSFIIAFSGCGPGAAAPTTPHAAVAAGAPGTPAGTMAPDFTVDLIDSQPFRLADHLGKHVIVIDFWATYCVPCVSVLEHLQTLHEKYARKGLVVLAVTVDPPETAGQIGPFVRSHSLTFAIAHDVDSKITEMYNKKASLPYQVLIGRDGRIVKRFESYQPGDERSLEQQVEAALNVGR